MNFLLISIIAYTLNAGAIIVDKILIRTALPKPLAYTFYVNLLQLLVIFLIPFGFQPSLNTALFLAISSGIIGVFAFFTYFTSLKHNEASVVGPLVGTFNPLFALILGGIFLGQILTPTQYAAFFVLIIGTVVLTLNLWRHKVSFGQNFLWLLASGFFFGLSYVLLREAFLLSNFLNGFIISRLTAGIFALSFLLVPKIRRQVISFEKEEHGITSRSTLLLLIFGQIMGAVSVTLITFGVSLANPALVNSLFGVQYLVILAVSLILAKRKPQLLDEHLSRRVIFQKIVGAVIISLGLYLLAQ